MQPLEDANERCRAFVGDRSGIERSDEQPELRDVYNANLPQDHPVLYGDRAEPDAIREFKGCAHHPTSPVSTPHSAKSWTTSCATSAWASQSLRPGRKSVSPPYASSSHGASSRISDNVLDATNAYAHYVPDARETAGLPADVLQARARSGSGGRARGLEIHAARAVLSARHAVTRATALGAAHVSGVCHARAEFGVPEWNNHAAHCGDTRAAQGNGATPGLCELRRDSLETQDGANRRRR